ncbi:snRNA-activating protein complex subunit 1a isoform X3 [Tachysurus fulvidraco]|uniref:snRNA-activating protein complex subunit 1a isoform X3 n=1 Tax=Tachysurus fulvidraco TaxID=1234273 RepID=UPI001FF04E6A|nr:snRNA-activating protein complex subunit 1a isoform X3 [Tachysurus fulvidraco]
MCLINSGAPPTCGFSVRMSTAVVKTCNVLWVPFKSDCEELLRRFQQTKSVRYEEFASIWRVMDFSSVYYFQIRVGALYMLYGLYFTQLVSPKEKISIALKDWMSVQNFVADAVDCQHLDVVYIYRKLVSEKAFFYSAMPNQLTFDAKRRFKNKNMNKSFQDLPDRVTELVNASTLEEIRNVQAHYERIKQALNVSASVSVTPVNLSMQLEECVLAFQQWQEKTKKLKNASCDKKAKESVQQLECSNRADLLASIKSKSYGDLPMDSKSRRHGEDGTDNSGSGTDHKPALSPQKNKQLSLRQRTWQSLGKEESEERRKQLWLLSAMKDDRAVFKKYEQKIKFKW